MTIKCRLCEFRAGTADVIVAHFSAAHTAEREREDATWKAAHAARLRAAEAEIGSWRGRFYYNSIRGHSAE